MGLNHVSSLLHRPGTVLCCAILCTLLACNADQPESSDQQAPQMAPKVAPELTADASREPAAEPSAPGTVNPSTWPAASAPMARDEALEKRLDELLSNMSLEQKIGQIVQPDIASITPAEAAQYRIGSVLNGGNSAPAGQQYAPAEQWLALADEFYLAAIDPSLPGPTIPLIWGSDAVHGHGNVIGATLFPHNVGLGAADNPELIREIGRITALECA